MFKRWIGMILAVALLCTILTPFVSAEDELPFTRCDMYLESNLLRTNYADEETRTEIAVGDTFLIYYEDAVPADVCVNGEVVHQFKAEEYENYTYRVKKTGAFEIVVRSGETERISRSYTVIPSAEMYKRHVREDLVFFYAIRYIPEWFREVFEGDVHSPGYGWLFHPFLFPAVALNAFINNFHILFSFVRIVP